MAQAAPKSGSNKVMQTNGRPRLREAGVAAPRPVTRARISPSEGRPCSGIGLRAPHYRDFLDTRPDVGWIEVHSENYFGAGGAPLHYLERARRDYPLSLHGVGMSLGSTDELSVTHLQNLKSLIDRFNPDLVSEHLCWSSIDSRYLNDLLPLPYTEESLNHVSARIDRVQEFLGRSILIENLSSYLQFTHSVIPEWEFLAEAANRSGCGILLDINNVYVSSMNLGFDPSAYLDAVPADQVREIHLAGYTVNRYEDGEMLIDTHGAPVSDPVWNLYREAIRRLGPKPTLIEWDTDLPALSVLVAEAHKADRVVEPAYAES